MPSHPTDLVLMFLSGAAVGLALGIPGGAWLVTEASADPQPVTTTTPAPAPTPVEGEPGFDCRIHGNAICGPNNDQGVPAGIYDPTTGQLVTVWPVP